MWLVTWHEVEEKNGEFELGKVIGREIWPNQDHGGIYKNWGTGEVYKGRYDYIGFRAVRPIFPMVPLGKVRLSLAADDGARLKVNGRTIIDTWGLPAGTRREAETRGGIVEVEWYEWVGGAMLDLVVSGDIPFL